LVGHDWGGAIGYGFCGKYPDMVSQYITCNLPHPASLAEQWKSSLEQVGEKMSYTVFDLLTGLASFQVKPMLFKLL
jgi:pimeloyl-ACP methyl ester carboxylesterase